MVENIGENGAGTITDFSYDENTHSNLEYTEDYISNNENNTVIVYGAYGSAEMQEKSERERYYSCDNGAYWQKAGSDYVRLRIQ